MPLRFRILPAPAEIRAGWVGDGASEWARGPSEERAFEIASEMDQVRIGRRPGAEIELPFPSVSLVHTRLFRGQSRGDWWVEDLGSTNGTWIDGVRLPSGRPRPLRPGQRLRIATVDIVFEGWSETARGAESTATIARRLISDLFGVVGGDVPTLAVEAGPARPSAVRLCDRDRRYLAGRADGCDLVLPSEHVSREHAAFVRHWDGVVVSDLGSKNGVLVNGTAIVGQARLCDGDRIEVGPVVFRFTDPEDRYVRRLESLENQVGGVVDSGTPPKTAAALTDSHPEALPSGAAVALDRQATKTGALESTPEPSAPSMADLEESGRPRRFKKWVPSALVGAVVVVAVAGLILLLIATR